MVKALTFKKITFKNPYKTWKRNFRKDAEALPKREAVFTIRRARSIMRPAPKKPKSRFGRLTPYGSRSAKYGKYYWRKGLYSRPGQPPFYHREHENFNLRSFGPAEKIKTSSIPSPSRGLAIVSGYRVGPKFRQSRHSTPVPGLHEFGGTVRLNKQRVRIQDRNVRLRRNLDKTGTGTLKYPPRPYMKPAAKEARESAARKSPNSLKKLPQLGARRNRNVHLLPRSKMIYNYSTG